MRARRSFCSRLGTVGRLEGLSDYGALLELGHLPIHTGTISYAKPWEMLHMEGQQQPTLNVFNHQQKRGVTRERSG